MSIHGPSPRNALAYERMRVALSICAALVFLFVWAIWMGLGTGGLDDYALFLLWAMLSTVGIYYGDRVPQRPIWGAIFGGIVGIVAFFVYWNFGLAMAQMQLAYTTRSIAPLLHPSENALGQLVILVMGILASLVLGAVARLASEGLTIGFRNREESAALPNHFTNGGSGAQQSRN